MTEKRLYELLNQAHGDEPLHKSHLIIEAMKQAVNEALDEAARIATENKLPKTSKEIDNLKVK